MDDLISKLSEIRSDYNCFDEDGEPHYRALSEAIRILSQRADGDTISRKAALDAITDELMPSTPLSVVIRAKNRLKGLPAAQPDHNADISKKAEGDCISRQAAIDALHMHLMYRMGTDSNKKRLDEWINNLPSVQPERKKGRWLRYGEDGYPNNEDTVFWQCDQCLEQYTGRTKRIPNFCPNCGADMRKENES